MIGAGNNGSVSEKERNRKSQAIEAHTASASSLRARAHQLSLREQLYSNHFLCERYYAASARLIQALGQGDVPEAIGEIIGNLIGSEEVAVFRYNALDRSLSTIWSMGLTGEVLHAMSTAKELIEHATSPRAGQIDDRQVQTVQLPVDKRVTACVPMRCGDEVVGVIVILNLLLQKKALEWMDYELLKFLGTYGAVAMKLQSTQIDLVSP